MVAEFDWWLLIAGLVAGGGLVSLVLWEGGRRDADVVEREIESEAAWISARLVERGIAADPPTAMAVLREHRTYLAAEPPDDPGPPDEP